VDNVDGPMCVSPRISRWFDLRAILVLNIEQYQRFMSVIRRLGDRVEKEHNQFLRDSQRIEDRSATNTDGVTSPAFKSGVDFESLVGRANGATVKPDTVIDGDSSKGWDDDVWGTIFSGAPEVTC
jgi:SCY1-like protein 2